jgi:23S rRNA (pseudouridine1915-N3)-methyltransferase
MLPFMHLTLVHIGARAGSRGDVEPLVLDYLRRSSPVLRCQTEAFRNEDAFLDWLDKQPGRTPVIAVLLDSRGRQMSSEAFAAWIGAKRDEGSQHIVFAVGPASGWSDSARRRAQLLLSFGQMTIAHALARLLMAEQIYRACTILTGHPYHTGH